MKSLPRDKRIHPAKFRTHSRVLLNLKQPKMVCANCAIVKLISHSDASRMVFANRRNPGECGSKYCNGLIPAHCAIVKLISCSDMQVVWFMSRRETFYDPKSAEFRGQDGDKTVSQEPAGSIPYSLGLSCGGEAPLERG